MKYHMCYMLLVTKTNPGTKWEKPTQEYEYCQQQQQKLEEAINKNIVYLGLKNYNSGDTDYGYPEGVFHGRERVRDL